MSDVLPTDAALPRNRETAGSRAFFRLSFSAPSPANDSCSSRAKGMIEINDSDQDKIVLPLDEQPHRSRA